MSHYSSIQHMFPPSFIYLKTIQFMIIQRWVDRLSKDPAEKQRWDVSIVCRIYRLRHLAMDVNLLRPCFPIHSMFINFSISWAEDLWVHLAAKLKCETKNKDANTYVDRCTIQFTSSLLLFSMILDCLPIN